MKYFICNCFFELKLGCGAVNIRRLITEDFIDFNYLTFVTNDCCYICCKETITFLFDCYRSSDIQYTCANIEEPICCIDLVQFGNEDICQICEKLLCFYFSEILSLVYNGKP